MLFTVEQIEEISHQISNMCFTDKGQARLVFESWVRVYGPDMARAMQHDVEKTLSKFDM